MSATRRRIRFRRKRAGGRAEALRWNDNDISVMVPHFAHVPRELGLETRPREMQLQLQKSVTIVYNPSEVHHAKFP